MCYRGGDRSLKKINSTVKEKTTFHNSTDGKRVRLMFQDEAGFGRISTPSYCWCPANIRPSVPCHRVREYVYLFGAVEPATGENFFLIMDKSDTVCMNAFLENLSKEYAKDVIILVCDNAPWHDGEQLIIPGNIIILNIPPYTPEMNPIEQIWTEIRKRGFKNVLFQSLDDVVSKLCDVVNSLESSTVAHISSRNWMDFV